MCIQLKLDICTSSCGQQVVSALSVHVVHNTPQNHLGLHECILRCCLRLPTLSIPSESLQRCGAIAIKDRGLLKCLTCFREREDSDPSH